MAEKRKNTPWELIDEHLGGEAVTPEMVETAVKGLRHCGWIKAWSLKKGCRIVYDCCGHELAGGAEDMPGDVMHRRTGVCPHCGAEITYMKERFIGAREVTEQYHVFYRRSLTEPNTLFILGVWAGRRLYEAGRGGYPPEKLLPEVQLCHMIYLPMGGTPKRWVREILAIRGRYGYFWKTGVEDENYWAGRAGVGHGYDTQSVFGAQIRRAVHLDGLNQAVRGTRWEEFVNWAQSARNLYYDDSYTSILSEYARHPQMEYLLKCGMEAIVRAKLNGNACGALHWQAKDAKGLLGLDGNELARLKRMKIPENICQALKMKQVAGRLGEPMKLETAMELAQACEKAFRNHYRWESDLVKLLRQFGPRWGVRRIIRYLIRQQSDPRQWTDYLEQLQQLGEAGDERRVFPKNLLEAHAEAGARIKYEHDQEKAREIQRRAEELRGRYTFRACGLVLRPFESPEEIVREGAIQSICIGGYVNAYGAGRTVLCALRRETEADKPWHAVEFTNAGIMVQCRGWRNTSAPEDVPVLERFWRAWDKKNHTKTEVNVRIMERRGTA